jgi:CPA2 family monovalent cation:H+ antiporter-2
LSGGETFVLDLATVLGVAGLTAVVVRAMGQSAIVGYLGAGFIVGPYIPLPVFADVERVRALAEFGVVLVMFAVGLEFSFARLARLLPRAGLPALFQMGTLAFVGSTIGRIIGFTPVEQVFLGAGIAVSSTMIVSKVYEERPVDKNARELVFGILVLQDLVAIVLVAALTAYAASGTVTLASMGMVLLELAAALLVLGLVGVLFVPRLVRTVMSRFGDEATIVVAVAIAFGFAAVATWFGYSTALGAFLGGVLVAESGIAEDVEHLVRPLRDVFAAIFFVSVGMEVDPFLAVRSLPAVLLVAAAVILGQLASVTLAGSLSGNGLRTSITAGLSLGQVGEFGFLIAAIGLTAGASPALHAVLVSVALLTAFTTPLLVGAAPRVVHLADAWLPTRLQQVLSVHETWFVRMRATGGVSRSTRLLWVIAIDALAILGVAMASAVWSETVTAWLYGQGVPMRWARFLPAVAALLLLIPLATAAARSTRLLSKRLAAEAVAGAAPGRGTEAVQRTIEAVIQLLVLLGLGAIGLAVLRPFLGPWGDLLGLSAVIALVAAGQVWRRAGELETEVRSGAEDVARILVRGGQTEGRRRAHTTLPGLDAFRAHPLDARSPAVGRTLAELDLRATTGASVVVIGRDGQEIVQPTGEERLREGDVLGLLGGAEAIASALGALRGPKRAP